MKATIVIDKAAFQNVVQSIKFISSPDFIEKSFRLENLAHSAREKLLQYFPVGKRGTMMTFSNLNRPHLYKGWEAVVKKSNKIQTIFLRHKRYRSSRVADILGALEYGSRAHIKYGSMYFWGKKTAYLKRTQKSFSKTGRKAISKVTLLRVKYVESPARPGYGYLEKTYQWIRKELSKRKVKFKQDAAAAWRRWNTGKKGYRK